MIRVCKNAFAVVYNIRKKILDSLYVLLSKGIITQEQRKAVLIPFLVQIENIYDFLKKLDVKKSHYLGKPKTYLDVTLNII